jgi:hypothetical protein
MTNSSPVGHDHTQREGRDGGDVEQDDALARLQRRRALPPPVGDDERDADHDTPSVALA